MTESSEPQVRTPIAVLVTKFPRIDEWFVLSEIDELERQGQPVVLVPLLHGSTDVVEEDAKAWVRRAHYLPAFSVAILLSNLTTLLRHPVRYLALIARIVAESAFHPVTLYKTLALFPKSVHLARMLPSLGVTHMHAHFATYAASVAYVISKLSGLTYSFTVHGPDVFVNRTLLERKIRAAKFVRAVSTFNKAFLRGLYPHIDEDKFEVVHVGLDTALYADSERGRDTEGRRLRILSAGWLLPSKGFGFLIEACGRLRREGVDLECCIVGDGPRREALEEYVRQHADGDIELVGALPRQDLVRRLAACDIFVLPSVIASNGQMDGIPITLVEAMAAGRPVVAASISGIPEVVTSGVSGILVDATHPERIAQSIRKLLDPELRAAYGRAAQESAREQFDVRVTTRALIALFDRHEENVDQQAKAQIGAMQWPELQGAAFGIRRLHARRDSFVAEVAVADGIRLREMVIKQHRRRPGESRPARQRARHEYETMRMLRERLADGDPAGSCSVPRVEAFAEEQCALLLARAAGTPLDLILRQARNRGLRVRRALEPLHRSGQWLARLQEVTRSEDDGRHLLTAVVLLALHDLDLVAAADASVRREREKLGERLQQLEALVAARPLSVVGHHGDYWPGNVFIGRSRVEVIDFEGYREGLPLEDVAYLLVMLELPFSYPILRRAVHPLRRAFLAGYHGDVTPEPNELRLFMATKALQILARGGMGTGGSLRRWWLRRNLIGIVRRSLA